MAIYPDIPSHRGRLARAVDWWHREMQPYRNKRAEIIRLVAGSSGGSAYGDSFGPDDYGSPIQLASIAHTLTLASGDPLFSVVAKTPTSESIVERLEAFLNHWSPLISLGDTARQIATASFYGWGVSFTSIDQLPYPAKNVTGQEIGPVVRAVDSDYLVWDGSSSAWEEVGYIGHMVDAPLDEAKNYPPFLAYNPEATENLVEFNTLPDREGAIHDVDMYAMNPEARVRLLQVYFPGTNVIAVWPLATSNFGEISQKPLLITPYEGYATGPYDILGHVDSPGNLIPLARSFTAKKLHELYEALSEQNAMAALRAKTVNMYEMGAENDILQLQSAFHGDDVGIRNLSNIARYTVPGPEQSKLSMMGTALALFKEMMGNLDDTLGLASTGGTATEASLVRARTTAVAAEMKRRMDRMMASIARKLAHLALNSTTLRMPIQVNLPGSSIVKDISWMPKMPDGLEGMLSDPAVYQARTSNVDDMGIDIIQGSMQFRSQEDVLRQINEAVGQIAQVVQVAQAGMPLDIEYFISDIQAKYRNLPQLRNLAMGLLPKFGQQKAESRMSLQRQDVGQYTRHNVSERTNSGALEQLLNQTNQQQEDIGEVQ